LQTITRLESDVRSYCRSWPTTFERAKGHVLVDDRGREYIDFFAGAGALNYGHNHPTLKDALLDHLMDDRIVHALDMATVTKEEFLERFDQVILQPRNLQYKVQFPGPTGTNAVEAALKLARKVTGRERVVGFTNAFHGMTLGSLSVTGNSMKRNGAGLMLSAGTSMPYDGYMGEDQDTIDYLEAYLQDDGSGLDLPAAVIVETVQAEGGINVASGDWLRRLETLCRTYEIVFIVDDIQVGCGRTGSFFSFEEFGLDPDVVCLSKALSGYGLPFAVTLLKPELDVWQPGEHNGTFRGYQPAFVTATKTIDTFWSDEELTREVHRKASVVEGALGEIIAKYPELEGEHRGRGLIQGIACRPGAADEVMRSAFETGLIVETSGPSGEVVKLLPPLTIEDEALSTGLSLLAEACAGVAERVAPGVAGASEAGALEAVEALP
jgi:diaminobutyrate-2-oxoglutarate transaminase